MNQVLEAYPVVDKQKLKSELTVLYQRRDFWNFIGIIELNQTIVRDCLQKAFSEFAKLTKIQAVTSMTTSEAERCFSTLKVHKIVSDGK